MSRLAVILAPAKRRAVAAGRWLAAAFVLAVLVPAMALAASDEALRDYAARLGLRDVDGFVATIRSLEQDGRLPPRYLSKGEARRRGWQPGEDLCRIGRDAAIGGDVFRNFEGRLPEAPRRRWREADLDYACGKRGAKRLVFSNDGLRFVTTDHYRSFQRVPD